MNTALMTTIKDKKLRTVLISVAENLENLLKTGKISLDTPLKSKNLDWGLRIDCTITSVKSGKPNIITFHYAVNTAKFRDWLAALPELCEDFFGFVSYGVRVHVNQGKWDKAGFHFMDDSEEVWLNLLSEETKFRVHRDLFGEKEWCVYLETSAAPSAV